MSSRDLMGINWDLTSHSLSLPSPPHRWFPLSHPHSLLFPHLFWFQALYLSSLTTTDTSIALFASLFFICFLLFYLTSNRPLNPLPFASPNCRSKLIDQPPQGLFGAVQPLPMLLLPRFFSSLVPCEAHRLCQC